MTAPLLALGYGAYLVQAYARGVLYVYIHPIYVLPALVTGLILVALGAVGLAARRRAHDGPSWTATALLALPLALGFLLPPAPLGLASAAQRGLDLEPAASGEVVPVAGPPESFTIKDWINTFQADPEPMRHAGKPVRVTGFVVKDGRLPEGWFLVARFIVQCCAVDAQPIGLVVRPPAGASPAGGAWVAVDGVVDVAEVGGERRPIVGATTVAPTDPPAQPYLY